MSPLAQSSRREAWLSISSSSLALGHKMDSPGADWEVWLDEEVETPTISFRLTVESGPGIGPYPNLGWRSRSSPFGVGDSYLIRLSALFVIICFSCCYYYFAHIRRGQVKKTEPAPKGPPEVRGPAEKEEPEPEDPAKVAEAKMNAALAARSRQEAFDKSGAEEEARKLAVEIAARKAAEFSKKWPRHRGKRDENPLQWYAGTSTRRGFI